MPRRASCPVLFLALLACSLAALPGAAQPFPQKDVPPQLKPWVPWALDEAKDRLCPAVGESAVCLWPGRLDLVLSGSGGSFTLEAYADRELFLPLPGDARAWPQEVRLDGAAAPLVEREELPALWLAPGRHRVEGRFAWKALPDSLRVPPAIALVSLSVEGQRRPFPRREEDGLLLLRGDADHEAEGEELRLSAFRRVQDGIPVSVETRLLFDVSGKAREVRLAGALLEGALPVSVGGDLPSRLDASGSLLVQVRAGRFWVTVLSRLPGKPATLARPASAVEPWPDSEVWVFAPNEELRQAELTGAVPVDPSRTDLPDDWKKLAAYQVDAKTELGLKETRRGEGAPSPDRIGLVRQVWLDLDGKAFTLRDRFSGTLTRTTRLELSAPGVLGRASVDGEDQLVTLDPKTKGTGVELRKAALALEADSRLPRKGGRLSAVGWKADVQSLSATLHLPPGWRLLGASGVDRAPGAWIGSWSLLSFFLVLVVSLAAWRLFGTTWGVVALAALVAVHGEAGAPRLVWLSLLGAAALLTVAKGKLKTAALVWWGGTALALVVIVVPFVVRQIRQGLFPQTAAGPAVVETGGAGFGFRAAPPMAVAPAPVPQEAQIAQETAPASPPPLDQVAAEAEADVKAEIRQKASSVVARPSKKGYAYSKSEEAYRQDPHAVIQTGTGIPDWSWRSEALVWSGPVASDQTMRLWLLPPFGNLLLAFLRVALVVVLAARLAADLRRHLEPLGAAVADVTMPIATVALLLALLVPASLRAAPAPQETPAGEKGSGAAVFPDADLLEELKTRLTRPSACAPRCVTTAAVTLTVSGGTLSVEAEVHAAADSSWPVPGPVADWIPASVTLDGTAAAAVVRHDDGFLHLRLAPGTHRVALSGPLPPRDSLALQFPERPRRIRASAEGWQVDGVREDGTTDGAVQLSRRLAPTAGGERGAEGTYAPWLEVARVLEVGVSWRVETVVRRLSPTGSPVVVKVPLLPGLMVADPDLTVADGAAVVTLGRDETEVSFAGTLTPRETEPVLLSAAEGQPWSEVWVVRCGAVWQCEAEAAFPPVTRSRDGRLAPEFRPWPGETLTLRFRRPAGAPGQSVTVDRASLSVTPGVRLTDATLSLDARASRTGTVSLRLPAGAELQTVKIRGSLRPVKPEGEKLVLPVEAGAQEIEVTWRQKGGMSLLTKLPRIGLDLPAANANVALNLPADRWLLLAGGPRWGPAILFWGYLLAVALAAVLLGRVPWSPLATWEWLLLAFGLTQIPLPAALVVAGWFLVFAWRRRKPETSEVVHDLVQVGLVIWTVFFAVCLYAAVHQGLLLRPDMQVGGNGSGEQLLRWYADRVEGTTPSAWVLSLPLWIYRVVMLLWSLWLATRLIRWTGWAWESFTTGGGWKRTRPLGRRVPPPPPMPSAGAPPPPPPPPPPPAPFPEANQ